MKIFSLILFGLLTSFHSHKANAFSCDSVRSTLLSLVNTPQKEINQKHPSFINSKKLFSELYNYVFWLEESKKQKYLMTLAECLGGTDATALLRSSSDLPKIHINGVANESSFDQDLAQISKLITASSTLSAGLILFTSSAGSAFSYSALKSSGFVFSTGASGAYYLASSSLILSCGLIGYGIGTVIDSIDADHGRYLEKYFSSPIAELLMTPYSYKIGGTKTQLVRSMADLYATKTLLNYLNLVKNLNR